MRPRDRPGAQARRYPRVFCLDQPAAVPVDQERNGLGSMDGNAARRVDHALRSRFTISPGLDQPRRDQRRSESEQGEHDQYFDQRKAAVARTGLQPVREAREHGQRVRARPRPAGGTRASETRFRDRGPTAVFAHMAKVGARVEKGQEWSRLMPI